MEHLTDSQLERAITTSKRDVERFKGQDTPRAREAFKRFNRATGERQRRTDMARITRRHA